MTVTVRADFVDEAGRLLFQEVETATGRKMRRPDGNGGWIWNLEGVRRVLWNLPRLRAHLANGRSSGPVYVVEGTSDASALDAHLTEKGLPGVVTTNPHGARSWRSEHTDVLTGAAEVVAIVDVDEAGYGRALDLHQALGPVVDNLRIVRPCLDKFKADARDHLAAGYGVDDFLTFPIHIGAEHERIPAPFCGPPPDVAGLLDELVSLLRRFVVCSDAGALAVALWSAHTYVFAVLDATPYLAVTSAELRSGKSRVLDVLELVVARPWRAITPTEAVTFRKIERDRPTLLLDEVDALFGPKASNHEGLRALLNAGNRRGTRVPRCVGQSFALQEFEVFCPKALAGIGELPATIADRSVSVRLKRKMPTETVERFRQREQEQATAGLRDALARWGERTSEAIAEMRPELPEALNDRAQDAWEPLLAIADLAGGEWPARARAAAVALSGASSLDSDSSGVRLLADCRAVFDDRGDDRLSSADLASALAAIEEAPWGEWHGKPLSTPSLARILARYEIRPGTVWLGDGKSAKGYKRENFADAWSRYLPFETSGPSGAAFHAGLSTLFDPPGEGEPDVSEEPANQHGYSGLTDLTAGTGDTGPA